MPKPAVMVVNGIAFTLSIELALAADIVIAADDVRFRQLEIGRGIIPFGGATFRAPAQLGWGNAMRFLLTAEEYGAAEALRIGLVQEVVPAGAHVQRWVGRGGAELDFRGGELTGWSRARAWLGCLSGPGVGGSRDAKAGEVGAVFDGLEDVAADSGGEEFGDDGGADGG